MDIPFSQNHLLETVAFPHCIVLEPLWKITWPHMWGLYLGFLFHWSICLSYASTTVLITAALCWWCLVTKSCLTLAIPWTIAHQAPLSMEFTRQEYWSSLVINFEIRDFQLCYSSRFLALQGLLRFNMNFKMDFFLFLQKMTWGFW